jgi:hypothetical protein
MSINEVRGEQRRQLIDTQDFDGDGKADILWRDTSAIRRSGL